MTMFVKQAVLPTSIEGLRNITDHADLLSAVKSKKECMVKRNEFVDSPTSAES